MNNLDAIKVQSLWEKTKGEGSVVAVLDTGCSHPDLKPYIIDGINLGGYPADPTYLEDVAGHGTHVAGIIHSIAPETKLLIVKIINDRGIGLRFTLVEALRYVIGWRGPNGEKVCAANVSMIGNTVYDDERLIIEEAKSKGINVCCGAGNDGDGKAETIEVAYPAVYDASISVVACDNYGNPASYCDTNDFVKILAPGEHIYSTWCNGGYRYDSGTSMATPHATGVLALINSLEPDLTALERYEQLIKCTRDLGIDRKLQGYGMLDCSKYTPYTRKEENEDMPLRGIIVMNTLADQATATRLHNRYHLPMIEMQFAGEDEKNAKVKLQVGNMDILFTPDTIRMAGVDRDKTDDEVTKFIAAHPTL